MCQTENEKKSAMSHVLVQYSRTLKIHLRCSARTIPDVASTCENIGLALKQQGDVEKAKDKFEEAADIRRAKLGAHHAPTKKSERLAANCLKCSEKD